MGSADEVSIDVQSMWSEMDTKIHRFPAGLRGIDNQYIVPRVVAIGPYHHHREHLQMMEGVKQEAVHYFSHRKGLHADNMREAVRSSVVDTGARGKYIENTATKGMTDDIFVDMMLRDACFLLVYMYAYSQSLGKEDQSLEEEVYSPGKNWSSMRRFLFSNRDSIENDIMLLENQLPWPVIQTLIDPVSPQETNKKDWLKVVSDYIVSMGNTFKVLEQRSDGREAAKNLNIRIKPPPHLLALLRRHKIEAAPAVDDEQKPKCTSISAITPMELEEIGVKLKPNGTDAFSDMDFVKGHLLRLSLRELSLAPLSLSGPGASCLVNMAAFEVCTASRFLEDPNKTAVCSYLALLAMFMVRKDDVHKLRSQGLLHGPLSNMEMLTFFNTVTKHLPDSGSRFAHIMQKITEYKNNSPCAKVYKFVYKNLMTFIKWVSILVTLITFYKAVMSLNKEK